MAMISIATAAQDRPTVTDDTRCSLFVARS